MIAHTDTCTAYTIACKEELDHNGAFDAWIVFERDRTTFISYDEAYRQYEFSKIISNGKSKN